MTCFVPESPFFPSLPFHQLPEDHRSCNCINRSTTLETRVGDRLWARVLFVGNSRLHDAVLPLFEGVWLRTQHCLPCFSVCGEQPSVRCCPPVVQGEGNVLRLGGNVLRPLFFYPVRAIWTPVRAMCFLVKLCTLHYSDIICNCYQVVHSETFFFPQFVQSIHLLKQFYFFIFTKLSIFRRVDLIWNSSPVRALGIPFFFEFVQ